MARRGSHSAPTDTSHSAPTVTSEVEQEGIEDMHQIAAEGMGAPEMPPPPNEYVPGMLIF